MAVASIYHGNEIAVIKKLLNMVFLLAFVAGGLGNVLAAALCEHRDCMSRAATADVREAAPEETAPAQGHCHESAKPSEHQPDETASVKEAETSVSGNQQADKRRAPSCVHCMGAPSAPLGGGFELTQTQTHRQPGGEPTRLLSASLLKGVSSFPALLAPKRGSPPTPIERKHILIQVFLI